MSSIIPCLSAGSVIKKYPTQVLADLAGHLWVRRIPDVDVAAAPPGSVYDIIDTRGVIVDRVRIPAGATVLGFGRGVVYLGTITAAGHIIARAPIR